VKAQKRFLYVIGQYKPCLWSAKPRGMQSSIFLCLSQARINWEGCGRKGIRRKNEGDDGGGSLISSEGVAPSWTVGVSTSVIFPCTIKIQKIMVG